MDRKTPSCTDLPSPLSVRLPVMTDGIINESGQKAAKRNKARWEGTYLKGRQATFFHLLLAFILVPHLFAQSNGVEATLSRKENGAAALAAVESFTQGNQQQPLLASAYQFGLSVTKEQNGDNDDDDSADAFSSTSVLSPLSIQGSEHVANRTLATGHVSMQTLLAPRWGHTSAYLPDANVLLFTGGQIGMGSGSDMVTNDVFALDMTNVTSETDTTSRSALKRWKRLSSNRLAPHAYAARAVTHTGHHQGEHLFLIGGATADCSISNSPVYVWTAGENGTWQDGSWTAPTVAANVKLPPRRRGAMAVQVPVSIGMNATEAAKAQGLGGTSFMVLGGYMDYTTCNDTLPADMAHPVEYPYVDIWTIGKNSSSKAKRNLFDVEHDTLTVRTLPLDPRMQNMSIIDYSTVILPANQTSKQSARVLFIGGRDGDGAFSPMNQIWSLDVQTSKWDRMQTTNGSNSGLDIPLGRFGHSSTMLDDGTVLVHGGYETKDADQLASNDTYLLDPRVNPAVWHKITPSIGNGAAPRRAYHSAVIAKGVLVLGFGQEGMGTMAGSGGGGSGSGLTSGLSALSDAKQRQTTVQNGLSDGTRQLLAPASAPVHYLDTSSTSSWQWTTDYMALMTSRNGGGEQSDSSNSNDGSTSAPSDPTADPTNSKSDTPSASQSSMQKSKSAGKSSSVQKSDAASGTADAQSASSPTPTDGDNENDNDGGNNGGAKQRNTAVIASVLGATALAASLGGLYFARKRQARLNNDGSSIGDDDKYERYASSPSHPAPPVSSLWINQPIAWANTAGKGLRRHASMASEAFLARTRSMRAGGGAGQDGQRTVGTDAYGPTTSRARAGWRTMSSPAPSMAEDDLRYTGETASFQVLRKLPRSSRLSVRRSEMERQRDVRARLGALEGFDDDDDQMVDVILAGGGGEKGMEPLPDDFIKTLLDDDDVRAQRDIRRTVDGDVRSGARGGGGTLRRGESMARHRSSESLASSSVDGASHFSYPYLAAMHRPSIGEFTSSPTSSKEVGLTGPGVHASPPPSDGVQSVISPREALLRASLSRSPGSQPLYKMATGALTSASPAWSSPALDLLWGGKNARLGERIRTNPFASSKPLQFGNPFADETENATPRMMVRDDVILEDERPTTELDFTPTVLAGQGDGLTPRQRPVDSPTMSLALFPWEEVNGKRESDFFSTPHSPSPFRHPRAASPLASPLPHKPVQRLPFYQQPIAGGVRLPIHPALLNAAAAQQNAHVTGNRRARPSLLRVTNQNDEQ